MSKKRKARPPVTLETVLVEASETLYPAQEPHLIEVNATSSDGDTPLHCMALRGDCVRIRLLIEAGASVDAVGDMGCTPLYYVVMMGNIEAARLLVEFGADPKIMTELDYSPLSLAKEKGDKDMLQALKR